MKFMSATQIERPRADDGTRTLIESEVFNNVLFEIKQGHVIVFGGRSGTLAVSLKLVDDLIHELSEIKEMYI